MIQESAQLNLDPTRIDEFFEIFPQAVEVLKEAKGFISLEVRQGIERPGVVLLTIQWQTLEDHTEGFRGGPLFPRWREIISPFFQSPPEVEHFSQTLFAAP